MSCISMSVGLGNVWRFPFVAYENGGGAFLIPYIIILFLVGNLDEFIQKLCTENSHFIQGKPLYYFEMIIGQLTSQASVKMWNVIPILRGIALSQLIGTACIVTYFSTMIALTLFYVFRSFSAELPWSTCWSSWTESCVNASSLEPLENRPPNASSSSELYFL